MSYGKRPKLPRGLRWRPKSSQICFSWRDAHGCQHQQSTHTADPAEAMAFKLNFLREKKDAAQERKVQSENRSRLPLEKAAELYFNWKAADISPRTIAREKRLFKSVEKFIGGKRTVRSIDLQLLEEYQEERRKQISPTMKKAVTARTVNYELRLLRGVMRYAKCWTGESTEGYKPLRQKRRRVGRVATCCAAVAAGTGCRSWEIKNLRLEDIRLTAGTILIREEIAKNRQEREPCLMALAEWGLQELLYRARQLGASEPEHYLLPLDLRKSRHWSKKTKQKWDVTQPMTTWVKSWRKLMEKCNMRGFRFHDLRHTFRTQGAEAGVPLEVMMAQLGHMDRETSLEYVHIQQRAFERAKALIEQEQAEIVFAAKGGVRSNSARATTATAATRIALPELPEHHDAKNLRRVPRSSP